MKMILKILFLLWLLYIFGIYLIDLTGVFIWFDQILGKG